MLYSYSTPAAGNMGAPSLPAFQPVSRHFPQWSRTAILTIASDAEGNDEVKKSPAESNGTAGFIIGGDAAARVAHLEHSVRFLQEQHRLMLSGLHAEIEALRERNRDLQFQLIFNKESTVKATPPVADDTADSNEEKLRQEVGRLEKEAAAARGEARAAEARALQLQRLVDAQAEKLRELEVRESSGDASGGGEDGSSESRAELRLRLAEAERLVRRLRADAERQRREVLGGAGVTNLLFDGAAARHAHLQCMKNSLHASLRASGLDSYGFQNHYHFPPVHNSDFWREPLREEYSMGSRNRNNRRPLTLPELTAVGQPLRATVYANPHARVRGYDKNKKSQSTNGETTNGKNSEEPSVLRLLPICTDMDRLSKPVTGKSNESPFSTYPELKIVVTKIIPHGNVSTPGGEARGRTRRSQRKHSDHT
ncbi:uncharacterized protein LOC112047711 isoform X2 [Bicyclus anynana]|uniref:Uncharacterized protein LOC112047711 isoform X2 n=1 Tax=Bicyclus anynana TaxID=110368 RepID=A0ABM3LQE9_BICAN|nr:uncharacterized protein LOC112047711 isoform X2 [Bicyclus anynana]